MYNVMNLNYKLSIFYMIAPLNFILQFT